MNREPQKYLLTSIEFQLLPVVIIENRIINIHMSDKRHNALFLFNFFICDHSLSRYPYIENEIKETKSKRYSIKFSYEPCFD
jgi:hypothetical protein